MRALLHACVVVLVIAAATPSFVSAQTPATSITKEMAAGFQRASNDILDVAEAMPAEKFTFKATPAQRDFGGHVMHIAQINMMVLKTLGGKAPAPAINEKATSKADTIKAMSDSFDYGTAVLNEQTEARRHG